MRYVSLFSGAGGWDLGCDAAGWECVAQVEWDKWATAVLERHWPNVPRWSDIADVNGAELPAADVVCFGSPCTDLSVAGQRAGIDGNASGLYFEAIRILKKMRAAGTQLRAAIWENVAGALSSNSGRDFGVVLDELAAVGAVDIEWRLVDGLAFGPPQRRTRLFVVARFDPRTDGRREVFAESESVRRDSAPVGEAGEDVAGTLGGGSGSRGWSPDTDRMTFVPMVANTLTARDAKGVPSYLDAGQFNVVGVADNQRGEVLLTEHMHQLTTGGGKPGQGYPAVLAKPIQGGSNQDQFIPLDGYSPSLAGAGNHHLGHHEPKVFAPPMAVRRLTPRECERLMGWPDDHTRWTANGREIADSHRYRMCGNGVMAPMGEWVARRVTQALEPTTEENAA